MSPGTTRLSRFLSTLGLVAGFVLTLTLAGIGAPSTGAQDDGAVDEVQVLAATYNPGDEPDDVVGYRYTNLTAVDAPDIPVSLDLDDAGTATIQIYDAETGELLGEGQNGDPAANDAAVVFEIPAGTPYIVQNASDTIGSDVYTGSATIVAAYNPATGAEQPAPSDDGTGDPTAVPSESSAAGASDDAGPGDDSGASASTAGSTTLPNTGAGQPGPAASGSLYVIFAAAALVVLALGGMAVGRRNR